MTQLKKHLRRLQRQNAHKQWFIFQQSLCQLMKKDKICETLKKFETKTYFFDEIISFVFKNDVKIFFIFILIYKFFLKDCFIKYDQFQNRRLLFDSKFLKNKISIDFIQESVQKFYEKQWKFITSKFFRSIFIQFFNKNVVLPFITNKKIDKDDLSTIYKIALHSDHQKLEHMFGQKVSINLFLMNDWQIVIFSSACLEGIIKCRKW